MSWSPSSALDRDHGDKTTDDAQIGEANMAPKHMLLALLLGLLVAVPAQAGDPPVVYTVFNPAAPPFPFVLFSYDSPGFITTDTTVSAAQLAISIR